MLSLVDMALDSMPSCEQWQLHDEQQAFGLRSVQAIVFLKDVKLLLHLEALGQGLPPVIFVSNAVVFKC